MSELNWQPSASFTALRARASVLDSIRQSLRRAMY